jgi:hypothetical protein
MGRGAWLLPREAVGAARVFRTCLQAQCHCGGEVRSWHDSDLLSMSALWPLSGAKRTLSVRLSSYTSAELLLSSNRRKLRRTNAAKFENFFTKIFGHDARSPLSEACYGTQRLLGGRVLASIRWRTPRKPVVKNSLSLGNLKSPRFLAPQPWSVAPGQAPGQG